MTSRTATAPAQEVFITDTHRGEGHVSFSIRPRPDSPLGTVLTNSASIVFDTNEPILTNEVRNVIGVPDYELFLPVLSR